MGFDGLIETVIDSPKETWLVLSCVSTTVVSEISESFSALLDCVEVVAQVVLDDVAVSLREESTPGPASLSSSLLWAAGLSELSPGTFGSSFTPRWF